MLTTSLGQILLMNPNILLASQTASDYNSTVYGEDARANFEVATAKGTAYSLQRRRNGRLFPLKSFHNAVKRGIIRSYVDPSARVLDIGGGRLNDLPKFASTVNLIHLVDNSPEQLREAKRRYSEFADKPVDHIPIVTFECLDVLSLCDQMPAISSRLVQADNSPKSKKRKRDDPKQPSSPAILEVACDPTAFVRGHNGPTAFQYAQCMFALHYFAKTERTLCTALFLIAANLQPGGIFAGIAVDGTRVFELLQKDAQLCQTEKDEKKSEWRHKNPIFEIATTDVALQTSKTQQPLSKKTKPTAKPTKKKKRWPQGCEYRFGKP